MLASCQLTIYTLAGDQLRRAVCWLQTLCLATSWQSLGIGNKMASMMTKMMMVVIIIVTWSVQSFCHRRQPVRLGFRVNAFTLRQNNCGQPRGPLVREPEYSSTLTETSLLH